MKVSVLVAAYNRYDYLKECLESIRNQTFKDFELIVVDDGSTEDMSGIEDLCDIYYRFGENKGISATRNMSMDLARGEYIFIVDSDDVLEPTCIEEELNLIEDTGADMVFCRLPFINCEGVFVYGEFSVRVQTIPEVMREKLMPHPSSLIRRSSLGKAKYSEEYSSAVDLDFLLSFMLQKKQDIRMLDRPLYRYRIHGNQETSFERQKENAIRIREKYAKIIARSAQ